MKKGFVDPHRVHKVNKSPSLRIPKKFGGVLEKMNCRIEKGKMSRDDAARALKMVGAGINIYKDGDLPTNIEQFRPQGFHPAFRIEPQYEKDFG